MKETHLADRGQFVGAMPLRQTVAGVTLAEVVHTCGRALPGHVHRDPYLRCWCPADTRMRSAARGASFSRRTRRTRPRGSSIATASGTGGATFFTVSFDPEAGGDYTERRSIWDTPQRWDASGPAYCLSRLHVQFTRSGGALDPLHVDDCLMTLWGGLARMRREEARTAAWLQRARARLHDGIRAAAAHHRTRGGRGRASHVLHARVPETLSAWGPPSTATACVSPPRAARSPAASRCRAS